MGGYTDRRRGSGDALGLGQDLPPWLDGGSEHANAWRRETEGAAAAPGGRRHPRRRAFQRARRWIRPAVGAGVLALLVAAILVYLPRLHLPHAAPARPSAPATSGPPPARYSPSNPPPAWSGPLPYPVLIADQGGHRLLEISPTGTVLWSDPPAGAPASTVPAGFVSFAPGGSSVIATGEHSNLVQRISFATDRVLWQFPAPGASGALHGPTAGYLLSDGEVLLADVGTCHELLLSPSGGVTTWGLQQHGYCQSDPAKGLLGYPNGDQPQSSGDVLVTLGSGDLVAMLSASGSVLWARPAPTLYGGIASDAQAAGGGLVLVTGDGDPGSVVLWNPQTGAVPWQYHVTSGSGALDHPTMALPLPGGNVLVVDGGNNRLVVIDPHTNTIVWTYTHALHDPSAAALALWRNWQAHA